MKTLHLSIIAVSLVGLFLIQFKTTQADGTDDISIQNIQVLPTVVKIGNVFTVNATLLNNSSNTVSVWHGVCEAPFSVTFDNHVHVSENNLNCTTNLILQKLDPGEKITATSPYIDLVYKAVESGNSSATVTFSYHRFDPITQSDIEKSISKSFSFAIHDNKSTILNYGRHPVVNQIDSPLKQFQSGITASKVVCNQGFQLILKREDGSPVCVKLDTAKKLLAHGWGTIAVSSIDDTGKQEKNGTLSGDVVLAGGPSSLVGPKANYEVDVYATDGVTIVGKTLTDANAHYSIQLPPGNYIIYASDYPTKQTHTVSVFSGKDTILNIVYGKGYK